jgi:hypothetical protein
MRRVFGLLLSLLAVVAVPASVALAGSPHFVDDTVQCAVSGTTLACSGKEAGLGDEAQVHIVISATAACINPGNNHPQAANKESVSAAGDFPVQNGKAEFRVTLTATFQPECSPPMTVEFSHLTVVDTTNGITASL